jgi:hypothetical protein
MSPSSPPTIPESALTFTKTYRIGQRFTVQMVAVQNVLDPANVQVRAEWSPPYPGKTLLSQIERVDQTAMYHNFAHAIARHYDIDVGEFDIREMN